MKYQVLILTADKSLPKWSSLKRKLTEINKELANVKNGSFELTVEYRDIVPQVVNGRITHEWMDGVSGPARELGYQFVVFHMSLAQSKKWGIKPTLRGSAQADFDLTGEAYLWADESTLRDRLNQFIQTFLHELRHLLMRSMGLPDNTHELHDDGDIRGAFIGLDMAKYSPLSRNLEKQISLLQSAVILLKRLKAGKANLATAARRYLGLDASPRDMASDVVGCAESVSMVIRDVLPDFPIYTGTWSLNERLKIDKRFSALNTPQPGAIIISPTGTGNMKLVSNGHTGIFTDADTIASNDSSTGLWEENYTMGSWLGRWAKAGYDIELYKIT